MLLDLMWFLCLFINDKILVFLLLMFSNIIFILYTILHVFTFYMTQFITLSILDLGIKFLVLARCYLNCFCSVLFSNCQENLFFQVLLVQYVNGKRSSLSCSQFTSLLIFPLGMKLAAPDNPTTSQWVIPQLPTTKIQPYLKLFVSQLFHEV